MDQNSGWPVRDGNYIVADPGAPVAVCTLTDQQLPERIATLPGVAIVGTLATANLGIERLVTNVITNPAIGHLLICGKDSALFGPGQSLLALAEQGVDAERRILGATGFDPVLRNLTEEHIEEFRTHVNVVDHIGADDPAAIAAQIGRLLARPAPRRRATARPDAPAEEFAVLAAGGRRRQSVDYDPAGFLVVTLDRQAGQILVRHYRSDNTPAHLIRSRNGEAILLALLDHQLVTQLDHAAYLGAELAKAEAALRLDLRYTQDRPLRPAPTDDTGTETRMSTPRRTTEPTHADGPAAAPATAAPAGAAQSHRAFAAATPGSEVDITLEVAADPDGSAGPDRPAGPDSPAGPDGKRLDATIADPDPADPYASYRRTGHPARIRYGEQTRFAMGTSADIHAGAIIRVRGVLHDTGEVHAAVVVILTNAVTLVTA